MKKQAFSLIELLVSLIIISLILAALSPILTKKLKYREITFSSNEKSDNCLEFDQNGRCIMCSNTACTLCTTQIETKENYYVNPEEGCDYQKCPQENCKNCTKDGCIECAEGYKINEARVCEEVKCSKGEYLQGSKCLTCQKGSYQNLESHNEKSCKICPDNCAECSITTGECNLTLKAPESSSDCPGAYYYRGMCITTRNAGDEGGPSIDIEGVKVVAAGTSCSNLNCCWRGTKTVAVCKSNKGSTYSPCNRTACAQEAAKLICENYSTSYAPKWSLPTNSDKTILDSSNSSDVLGIKGLNFCRRNESANNCNTMYSGYDCCITAANDARKYCKGAINTDGSVNKNKCFVTSYHTQESVEEAAKSFSRSVRCVAKEVYK